MRCEQSSGQEDLWMRQVCSIKIHDKQSLGYLKHLLVKLEDLATDKELEDWKRRIDRLAGGLIVLFVLTCLVTLQDESIANHESLDPKRQSVSQSIWENQREELMYLNTGEFKSRRILKTQRMTQLRRLLRDGFKRDRDSCY